MTAPTKPELGSSTTRSFSASIVGTGNLAVRGWTRLSYGERGGTPGRYAQDARRPRTTRRRRVVVGRATRPAPAFVAQRHDRRRGAEGRRERPAGRPLLAPYLRKRPLRRRVATVRGRSDPHPTGLLTAS